MKQLSLSTPRVIFLMGIPGAGKTYFARKFSETFKAPFIELDQIRKTLNPKPDYSRREDELISDLAHLQMQELFKTRCTFLYEGGLEVRAERQRLTKYVTDAGYLPLFVWVQTEFATAEKRAVKGMPGHSKDHIISVERFDQLVNRFTTPDKTEKTVVLSGKHTYTTQARTLLRSISEEERVYRDQTAYGPVKQAKKAQRLTVPKRNPRNNSISL